ncbi:MAG: NAD(P)H-binding protein [Myxococcota bacterium]
MTNLITGASGALGQALVAATRSRAALSSVAFGTRRPDDLDAPDLEARRVDYDDPASMSDAFAGVDSLLLISTHADHSARKRQHRAAFEAAHAAGVRRILFTSLVGAHDPGDNDLLDVYADGERALAELGVPHVVFRDGIYLGLIPVLLGEFEASGKVVLSAGDTPVAWVSREDVAQFALDVLLDPEVTGTFEVAGPNMASMPEIVATLSAHTRNPIEYVHLPHKAFLEALASSGMPVASAEGFAEVTRAMFDGRFQGSGDAFVARMGRPAESVSEYLARTYRPEPND